MSKNNRVPSRLTPNDKALLNLAMAAVNEANIKWSFTLQHLGKIYELGPDDAVSLDGTINYGNTDKDLLNGNRTTLQVEPRTTEFPERTTDSFERNGKTL